MPPAKAADAGGHVGHAEAAQQVGQLALVGDDLRHARQRGDFLRRPRGIAAHHDDLRAGIPPRQPANRLPALGVALGRDRAGVDDAQLGRARRRPHPRSRCRASPSRTNSVSYWLTLQPSVTVRSFMRLRLRDCECGLCDPNPNPLIPIDVIPPIRSSRASSLCSSCMRSSLP